MDRLQHSAWQYVAEVLPPPELPMLAAYALADGRDSPALRELAGLTRRCDEAEIGELYALALEESGVALPDEETAGRLALVSLAIGLSDGALSPMDVMHRMGGSRSPHTAGDAIPLRRGGVRRMVRAGPPDHVGEGTPQRRTCPGGLHRPGPRVHDRQPTERLMSFMNMTTHHVHDR